MKNILLLGLLLTTTQAYAQKTVPSTNGGLKINFLSEEEYDNILINGANWKAIQETHGDPTQLKTLLGNTLHYSLKDDPNPAISFGIEGGGLSLYFEDRSGTGTYHITSFSINKNEHSLTVKGVQITIGDHISKIRNAFTHSLIEIQSLENNMISFSKPYTNSSIGIKFDKATEKIIKIRFYEYD